MAEHHKGKWREIFVGDAVIIQQRERENKDSQEEEEENEQYSEDRICI